MRSNTLTRVSNNPGAVQSRNGAGDVSPHARWTLPLKRRSG